MKRPGRSLVVAIALVGAGCARSDAVADTGEQAAFRSLPSTTFGPERSHSFEGPGPSSTALPIPGAAPSGGKLPAPPRPSIGCDDVSASADGEGSFVFGGRGRTYLHHRPEGVGGPLPVVIDFHALGDAARTHADLVRLADAADRHGFLLITPQALGTPAIWNVTQVPLAPDDGAFVTQLLDRIAVSDCIDTARVYTTGFSVGGLMAALAACVAGDRIAAVASVAGALLPDPCPTTAPVPIIAFHGTADRVMPATGGLGEGVTDSVTSPEGLAVVKNLALDPVPETLAAWAKRNGCGPEPTTSGIGRAATITQWQACDGGAEVALYTIEGGGHSWPGSVGMASLDAFGPTSLDVDANEIMWSFFERHSSVR